LPLSASIRALYAGPEAAWAAGSFSGSAALELADYPILGAPEVDAKAALVEPGLTQEVSVQVRGMRPGKGEVVIRVSPCENPQSGVECRHTIEIVDAPPSLRYGVHQDVFDALDVPKHLFALASFRSLAPEPMLATAGRWLRATAPSPEAPVWFPDRSESPPMRLSTLLGGEGWAQLPAKLKAPARLLIHRLETPKPFAPALAGAELQSGAGPSHEGVHLCFWSELKGLSDQGIAAGTAALRELFDSQLREGNLVSAFIVRWDRRSESSSVNEPTPYEFACDVPPDLVGLLEWCSSFVRGLGEQMWLGPSLVERIDLDGLSQVASIEHLGKGVRIDAKAGHTWHDFEEPLDPILPRQEKRRPRRRRRSSKKAD
jgi:hypothetical protein